MLVYRTRFTPVARKVTKVYAIPRGVHYIISLIIDGVVTRVTWERSARLARVTARMLKADHYPAYPGQNVSVTILHRFNVWSTMQGRASFLVRSSKRAFY